MGNWTKDLKIGNGNNIKFLSTIETYFIKCQASPLRLIRGNNTILSTLMICRPYLTQHVIYIHPFLILKLYISCTRWNYYNCLLRST